MSLNRWQVAVWTNNGPACWNTYVSFNFNELNGSANLYVYTKGAPFHMFYYLHEWLVLDISKVYHLKIFHICLTEDFLAKTHFIAYWMIEEHCVKTKCCLNVYHANIFTSHCSGWINTCGKTQRRYGGNIFLVLLHSMEGIRRAKTLMLFGSPILFSSFVTFHSMVDMFY